MPTTHTQLFVAFEGGDGAGKSTQVRLLADALRRAGVDVLETRQPGGTELGSQLRDLVLHGDHVSPRAEALLYAADKAHHVDTVVRPALARGDVVVTDRSVDSAKKAWCRGRARERLGRRRRSAGRRRHPLAGGGRPGRDDPCVAVHRATRLWPVGRRAGLRRGPRVPERRLWRMP